VRRTSPIKRTAWLPHRRFFVAGEVGAADEIPKRLPRKAVVLVSQAGRATWAAFDCPCKRRHRLMVNLDTGRKPYWRLAATSGVSLSPSIDTRDHGIRCHFVLRSGRAQWVGATSAARRTE
jgi:hypothetical protein